MNNPSHNKNDSVESEIESLVLDLSRDWNQYDDEQYNIYGQGGSWSGFCTHKKVKAKLQSISHLITKARIDERNEVALDNYRGHTFSDSTNYEAKFAKFIDNNEKRLSQLKNITKENK